jgi:magnesium transporter
MNQSEKSLETLSNIKNQLLHGTYSQINRMLNSLNPSEIAHLIESSPPKERELVWQILNNDLEGEVLNHLPDTLQEEFLKQMGAAEVIEATEYLETDELANILQKVPEAVIEGVLSSMSLQNRARLEEVLSFPEDSAGGLMNTDVIAVRKNHTLDVVLRYLRMQGSIPKTTNKIFVVNRLNNYLGTLSLNKLLISDPTLHVGDLFDEDDISILVDATDSEVARLFEREDLISAPVINKQGKLLGRITIDDVVDVIKDEADVSYRQLSGLEEDTFAKTSVATKSRATWLGLNLITAFAAAFVIDIFRDTIAEVVTLAVLMPIVASMGGVAATQTLTIMVRGLALGQIERSNVLWLIKREALVGLGNGIIWAIVVSLVSAWWFQDYILAQIIAIAMVLNLFIAVLSGVSVPLILRFLKLDPGIGGSVIVTTITDIAGFVSFLGLATIFLT